MSANDVSALYADRRKTRDPVIAIYNEVEQGIRGIHPKRFDNLWSESDVKLQIRTLRLADDGLTKFLSEIPVFPHVKTLGKRNSDKARKAAELVEKVAHSYNDGSAARGGVEFDGIRLQLARHQVRFGDGCLVIHPDYERKLVYFEVKDPRCHYPPAGWSPFSITPLDGTLLVHEMTLGEIKRRFCYHPDGTAKSDVLMRVTNAVSSGYGDVPDSTVCKLGVYRSREAWFMVMMADRDVVLAESQTGDRNHPGVCGVTSLMQFDSEPLMLGQIGIEAGLEKVLNQQMQNTERINKAPIVGPELVGNELKWGQYNVVKPALQPGGMTRPERLAPDSPTNLTQVMGSLLGLAQMFNYNPESNQGQGPANSGKALQQLQAGPRSQVTNILFSPYKVAFPRAYDDGMDMELNLWPNERKTASGTKGKHSFEVEYTPSSALQGYRGKVKIEDARPDGYNAFLEAVQKKDAGLTSLRAVLEADPDVRDVEERINQIESESVEAFVNAAFEGLGAADPLTAIKAASKIKELIDSGKSKFEAIQEVINQGMLEPPAPEMEPGMGGGMPPELAALMGGGMPPGAPPSLEMARGF